jgi:hypothetical protein
MTRPPSTDVSFNDLPADPQQRHEALVSLFGQYLFWARNYSLERARQLAEAAEIRAQLGKIFRRPYEQLGGLQEGERIAAYEFARACTDAFAKQLLALFGNEGFDLKMGEQHAIRIRLELEICDASTGEVIAEEVLNRGGKFFPDYWGQWLNQYGSGR